jgi:hypothetical protein
MQVGSIVQYRSRLDDEPLAAIVTYIWTDGKYELRIFGHDFDFHIRAADPSQVIPLREDRDTFITVPQTLSEVFAAEEAKEEEAVPVESTPKKKREAWPR